MNLPVIQLAIQLLAMTLLLIYRLLLLLLTLQPCPFKSLPQTLAMQEPMILL